MPLHRRLRTHSSFLLLSSRNKTTDSVAKIRGTHGADFEGYATLARGNFVGADNMSCCFCFGLGKRKEPQYLLIKSSFCFVYASESSASPKYAISLVDLQAKVQKETSSGTDVALESGLGDVEYLVHFASIAADQASDFVKAVNTQACKGQAAQIRKRLGHEHLLSNRASIRYAESVARKVVKEQPEKNDVTAEELLQAMPGESEMKAM
jgi:hypothetical protein